jgi:hypothetical protein
MSTNLTITVAGSTLDVELAALPDGRIALVAAKHTIYSLADAACTGLAALIDSAHRRHVAECGDTREGEPEAFVEPEGLANTYRVAEAITRKCYCGARPGEPIAVIPPTRNFLS